MDLAFPAQNMAAFGETRGVCHRYEGDTLAFVSWFVTSERHPVRKGFTGKTIRFPILSPAENAF